MRVAKYAAKASVTLRNAVNGPGVTNVLDAKVFLDDNRLYIISGGTNQNVYLQVATGAADKIGLSQAGGGIANVPSYAPDVGQTLQAQLEGFKGVINCFVT